MRKLWSFVIAATIATMSVTAGSTPVLADCTNRSDFLKYAAEKKGEIVLATGVISETIRAQKLGPLLDVLFGEKGMEKGDMILLLANQPWDKKGPWSFHVRKVGTGQKCLISSGIESWKSFPESIDVKIGGDNDNGLQFIHDENTGRWHLIEGMRR